MEIHKYQVSPSQVTLEESASQVTAPGHGPFLNTESKTKREKNTYKLFDDSWQDSYRHGGDDINILSSSAVIQYFSEEYNWKWKDKQIVCSVNLCPGVLIH